MAELFGAAAFRDEVARRGLPEGLHADYEGFLGYHPDGPDARAPYGLPERGRDVLAGRDAPRLWEVILSDWMSPACPTEPDDFVCSEGLQRIARAREYDRMKDRLSAWCRQVLDDSNTNNTRGND